MTQAEAEVLLDKLRKARASGVRSVQHGDTSTEYKSDTEMAAAIADLERIVAGFGSTPRRGVRYIFQRGKGL